MGFLALCLLGLPGCGGGTATSPSSDPFNQSFRGTVDSFGYVRYPFTPPRGGTAVITLTWTNQTTDLDLYLTAGSCASYPLGSCTMLEQSSGTTGILEEMRHPVTQGESLIVWIDNFSFVGEPYTLTINVQ